jgi:hypothetical protein
MRVPDVTQGKVKTMDDYKNPHRENQTFSPEELTISFFVAIEDEHEKQVEFIERFTSPHSPVVISVDDSVEGVTLLTNFNTELQSALPALLEAMEIITNAEVGYGLTTGDWDDVTYDLDLGTYRLMTEEELHQFYSNPVY